MPTIAVALVVAFVICATATALAQRGGYRLAVVQRQPARTTAGSCSSASAIRGTGGRGAPWAHDYPRGEEHFTEDPRREITAVPAHIDESSIMALGDPEIFKFPVIYMAEPGLLVDERRGRRRTCARTCRRAAS